jgi:hypothetical protein
MPQIRAHPQEHRRHPQGVEDAHQKDLEVQDKHGVRGLHHWYNENEGTEWGPGQLPTGSSSGLSLKASRKSCTVAPSIISDSQ